MKLVSAISVTSCLKKILLHEVYKIEALHKNLPQVTLNPLSATLTKWSNTHIFKFLDCKPAGKHKLVVNSQCTRTLFPCLVSVLQLFWNFNSLISKFVLKMLHTEPLKLSLHILLLFVVFVFSLLFKSLLSSSLPFVGIKKLRNPKHHLINLDKKWRLMRSFPYTM